MMDKKTSRYLHNTTWRIIEVVMLPYAVIHNPPGILFLSLLLSCYVCGMNAEIKESEATTADKLSIFLNYCLHVASVLVVTTFMKKFLARPRPVNPEADAPNRRYFNLRGNEHNCSLPSGDTS